MTRAGSGDDVAGAQRSRTRAGKSNAPRTRKNDSAVVGVVEHDLALPTVADLAPWERRSYERARAAFDEDRLAHGLLLCGPPRLGKRVVAELLAQRLLCEASAPGGDACGGCRSCRLFRTRTQHDPPTTRADGTLVHPWGRSGHPDALFVGQMFNDNASPLKMRSEIVIEQIREIADKFNLTPQYGRAVVVLVDPAHAVNNAASNAMLKTLEEPQAGRYLILLTSEPARLPATIRSRCQRLEFRLPSASEAHDWLHHRGHAPEAASEALAAARGNPGLAQDWLHDGSLELRSAVAADLQHLAMGREQALPVAQRWTSDEQLGLRLRFAADLALEQGSSDFSDQRRIRGLAAWFDAANRTRDLVRAPIRADLAVVELLLAWCDAMGQRLDSGQEAMT